MKIGKSKNHQNKKPIRRINRIVIGILAFALVFLSGALFQQRELDLTLYRFVKNLRYILINELNLVQNNGLQNLYLDIPYKSLDKIYQKREAALETGVLISSDEDFVPARIRLDQGKDLDVDIRLKGDWTDHLDTNKWSYRVHVKNGELVLGTKRFSIQAPETRNYVAEWAFHQHCLYEDILTTKYTFLNVYENGVYKGVYAFEESFSEELIEYQQQREGLILKLDEELYWLDRAAYIDSESYWVALEEKLFSNTDSVLSSEVAVFRETHLNKSPTLKQQKDFAIVLLTAYLEGILPADVVFDTQKTGKYYAMVDFWSANHASHWINIRFYYNPVTALIEPIAFDGVALSPYLELDRIGTGLEKIPLLDHPEVRAAYLQELQRLTNLEKFNEFKDSIHNEVNVFHKAIEREYLSLDLIWDRIESRRKMLSVLANPEYPVRGNFDIDHNSDGTFLNIRLKNLTIFPVEILQVRFNENFYSFNKDMLDTAQTNEFVTINKNMFMNFNKNVNDLSMPTIHLKFPIENTDDLDLNKVSVIVRVHEGNEKKEINLTKTPLNDLYSVQQYLIPNYEIKEVIEYHPFLRLDTTGDLLIPKGTWEVEGDLIIPDGTNLIIAAGANLLFQKDSLLLLRGGKLIIQGAPDNTTSLSSPNEPWAGILVIDAPEESFLHFTEISNTKGFERKGWMVTGGITFYQSDVSITNSVIRDSFAEDAINVIYSHYLFDNLSIVKTASDAFDGDFSDGIITNSYFAQIDGDAVDISGSNLAITHSNFDTIGDKGISAGEQSQVNALFINITNANIGIASKDLSHVRLELSEINNPNYIAFAAFQKKALYGPGSIEAFNVAVNSQDKIALVQTGSSLTLNDDTYPGVELDVKTLYDLEILGN